MTKNILEIYFRIRNPIVLKLFIRLKRISKFCSHCKRVISIFLTSNFERFKPQVHFSASLFWIKSSWILLHYFFKNFVSQDSNFKFVFSHNSSHKWTYLNLSTTVGIIKKYFKRILLGFYFLVKKFSLKYYFIKIKIERESPTHI